MLPSFLLLSYGSDLVLIESYAENNYTAALATRHLGPAARGTLDYWAGLTTVDSLRTNTLESAAGLLVSQYAGFWSLESPNVKQGECVDVNVSDERQSWKLRTCESLLPFLCRANACPTGKSLPDIVSSCIAGNQNKQFLLAKIYHLTFDFGT